jgi:hypothetical protein
MAAWTIVVAVAPLWSRCRQEHSTGASPYITPAGRGIGGLHTVVPSIQVAEVKKNLIVISDELSDLVVELFAYATGAILFHCIASGINKSNSGVLLLQ